MDEWLSVSAAMVSLSHFYADTRVGVLLCFTWDLLEPLAAGAPIPTDWITDVITGDCCIHQSSSCLSPPPQCLAGPESPTGSYHGPSQPLFEARPILT